MEVTTSSSTTTTYYSLAQWKGHVVTLSDFEPHDCDHPDLMVWHHYDNIGRHYCPTGFVECVECGMTGEEPDPPECTLMRQFADGSYSLWDSLKLRLGWKPNEL